MKIILPFIMICLLTSGCITDNCKDYKTNLGKIKDFEMYHIGFSETYCKVSTENTTVYIKNSMTCDNVDYDKNLYSIKSENCVKFGSGKEWYEID